MAKEHLGVDSPEIVHALKKDKMRVDAAKGVSKGSRRMRDVNKGTAQVFEKIAEKIDPKNPGLVIQGTFDSLSRKPLLTATQAKILNCSLAPENHINRCHMT